MDLIGGRRLWSTWSWLPTIAEKNVSSACLQSSDSGSVDGGRNSSLCALVMTAWRRCLSDASVKLHQTSDAYSRRLSNIDCPTIPKRDAIETMCFQNPESIKKTFGCSGLLSCPLVDFKV